MSKQHDIERAHAKLHDWAVLIQELVDAVQEAREMQIGQRGSEDDANVNLPKGTAVLLSAMKEGFTPQA